MTAYSPLWALLTRVPSLRRASGRALSMYIPGSPEGFDEHRHELELGHLVARFSGRFGVKDREVLERELPRLRARLAVVRPAGSPAIACFADEPNDVLELVNLPAPTEARLEVGDLLLAPILRELEEHPPALIAVVDKERAATFGFMLGDIEALGSRAGLEVRRTRAGGTSAASNQRRADNRAAANLETAAKTVEHEMDSGAYRWLYVAGPQEARAEFERRLSQPVRASIAGHLGASLDSPRLEHELREMLRASSAPA
jgi:hypothetical protein